MGAELFVKVYFAASTRLEDAGGGISLQHDGFGSSF